MEEQLKQIQLVSFRMAGSFRKLKSGEKSNFTVQLTS
jgi:hypothetical protein